MTILLYFSGALMFLDCVLLIFLVLLQLPKKEAGMGGMAFGGAATDALFGAGSGNVLTKITKYVAVLFFVLALAMAWMDSYKPESGASSLAKKLSQGSGAPVAPSAPPSSAPAAPSSDSGVLQLPNLPPGDAGKASTAPAPATTVKTNK